MDTQEPGPIPTGAVDDAVQTILNALPNEIRVVAALLIQIQATLSRIEAALTSRPDGSQSAQ